MPKLASDAIQWIAVCGRGYNSGSSSKPMSEIEREHLRTQLQAELNDLKKRAQRVLTHAAQLGETAFKIVNGLSYYTNLARPDPERKIWWCGRHPGFEVPGIHGFPGNQFEAGWIWWRSKRATLSIWVRDKAGKEHLVPVQGFTPWEFMSALERLVNDPNVAKVDVRVLGHWGEGGWSQDRAAANDMTKVWGRIVVAKRYSNIDALIKGLQPLPPPPEDKTVIATGPAAEAWEKSAQTPSGISPQGIPSGGSSQATQVATGKIDPRWALVAGAGILLLALIMRR